MKVIAPEMNSSFQRALDFMRHTIKLTADDLRPIDGGCVVRTPSLPQVWSLNHVRLTKSLPLAEAVEIADEQLFDLPYRQLHLEHGHGGPQLELQFRAAGWKVEREVVMALRREPDRAAATEAVAECSEEAMLAVMARWFAEGPPATSPEAVGQLVDYSRRESRARDDRRFAILDVDGRASAVTKLRSTGPIAQLEDVYTAPEARGRGHARALLTYVTSLARSEGHELIFIVADDEDWPKLLYRKIGFDPIGYTRTTHLDQPGGTAS
jgi:GNAT superfamily N-acetyltransferase